MESYGQVVCLNCEQATYKKSIYNGSFLGEICLWIVFFVIALNAGLILLIVPLAYTLYRALTKKIGCQLCGSENIVPYDSLKAQGILDKNSNKPDLPTH